MYKYKLSVVIVNYNVKYFLEQCLRSVEAAVAGLEVEIFVVDNHSADGSLEYLKPRFPGVTFIANEDNVGFARANNQAIQQAGGEYVLLLNPDTVAGEESIRTLCFFMDEHPECGGTGVKMINGNGAFLAESKRSFPTPWVAFCKLSGLSKIFPRSQAFSRYGLPFLDANKPHTVDVLSGAFMFLRHDALEKAGLLDEAFFMYGEDIDLSYRIKQSGYLNYYIPERLLHYKGESTRHGDIKYIKAFYGAMLIFYRKYYPRSGFLMRGLIRIGIAVKILFARFLGSSKDKRKRKQKIKHRRLLVFCREEHFEAARKACIRQIPDMEFVNLWDMEEERVMDAINRRNQMKSFTDYAFCFPDVRFEQMLLFMDKQVNKKAVYHIYHKENGVLVSPGDK
ncbi:MAG: glycosyltransferase family 2 protein [Tannerella sp.]|jgi:GT2 family glycosyltransferase|nr:glycosyltransferase family 2 protein [Tannerella sp.]